MNRRRAQEVATPPNLFFGASARSTPNLGSYQTLPTRGCRHTKCWPKFVGIVKRTRACAVDLSLFKEIPQIAPEIVYSAELVDDVRRIPMQLCHLMTGLDGEMAQSPASICGEPGFDGHKHFPALSVEQRVRAEPLAPSALPVLSHGRERRTPRCTAQAPHVADCRGLALPCLPRRSGVTLMSVPLQRLSASRDDGGARRPGVRTCSTSSDRRGGSTPEISVSPPPSSQ